MSVLRLVFGVFGMGLNKVVGVGDLFSTTQALPPDFPDYLEVCKAEDASHQQANTRSAVYENAIPGVGTLQFKFKKKEDASSFENTLFKIPSKEAPKPALWSTYKEYLQVPCISADRIAINLKNGICGVLNDLLRGNGATILDDSNKLLIEEAEYESLMAGVNKETNVESQQKVFVEGVIGIVRPKIEAAFSAKGMGGLTDSVCAVIQNKLSACIGQSEKARFVTDVMGFYFGPEALVKDLRDRYDPETPLDEYINEFSPHFSETVHTALSSGNSPVIRDNCLVLDELNFDAVTEVDEARIPAFSDHLEGFVKTKLDKAQVFLDGVDEAQTRLYYALKQTVLPRVLAHLFMIGPMLMNRYNNIRPNNPMEVTGGHYYNADFVRFVGHPRTFIASQGPIGVGSNDALVNQGPLTVYAQTADSLGAEIFWRDVVGRNKVSAIVMTTGYVEGGKNKCAKYFPNDTSDGPLTFGRVKITCTKRTHKENEGFSVRKLKVTVDGRNDFEIDHYHFFSWPDHGVPEAQQYINYHTRVTSDHPTGTILVHCSAGIGRTGTFIAMDVANEKQAKQALTLDDVKDIVTTLRQQRAQAIQTKGQFEFLREVLPNVFDGFLEKWTKAYSGFRQREADRMNKAAEIKRTYELGNDERVGLEYGIDDNLDIPDGGGILRVTCNVGMDDFLNWLSASEGEGLSAGAFLTLVNGVGFTPGEGVCEVKGDSASGKWFEVDGFGFMGIELNLVKEGGESTSFRVSFWDLNNADKLLYVRHLVRGYSKNGWKLKGAQRLVSAEYLVEEQLAYWNVQRLRLSDRYEHTSHAPKVTKGDKEEFEALKSKLFDKPEDFLELLGALNINSEATIAIQDNKLDRCLSMEGKTIYGFRVGEDVFLLPDFEFKTHRDRFFEALESDSPVEVLDELDRKVVFEQALEQDTELRSGLRHVVGEQGSLDETMDSRASQVMALGKTDSLETILNAFIGDLGSNVEEHSNDGEAGGVFAKGTLYQGLELGYQVGGSEKTIKLLLQDFTNPDILFYIQDLFKKSQVTITSVVGMTASVDHAAGYMDVAPSPSRSVENSGASGYVFKTNQKYAKDMSVALKRELALDMFGYVLNRFPVLTKNTLPKNETSDEFSGFFRITATHDEEAAFFNGRKAYSDCNFNTVQAILKNLLGDLSDVMTPFLRLIQHIELKKNFNDEAMALFLLGFRVILDSLTSEDQKFVKDILDYFGHFYTREVPTRYRFNQGLEAYRLWDTPVVIQNMGELTPQQGFAHGLASGGMGLQVFWTLFESNSKLVKEFNLALSYLIVESTNETPSYTVSIDSDFTSEKGYSTAELMVIARHMDPSRFPNFFGKIVYPALEAELNKDCKRKSGNALNDAIVEFFESRVGIDFEDADRVLSFGAALFKVQAEKEDSSTFFRNASLVTRYFTCLVQKDHGLNEKLMGLMTRVSNDLVGIPPKSRRKANSMAVLARFFKNTSARLSGQGAAIDNIHTGKIDDTSNSSEFIFTTESPESRASGYIWKSTLDFLSSSDVRHSLPGQLFQKMVKALPAESPNQKPLTSAFLFLRLVGAVAKGTPDHVKKLNALIQKLVNNAISSNPPSYRLSGLELTPIEPLVRAYSAPAASVGPDGVREVSFQKLAAGIDTQTESVLLKLPSEFKSYSEALLWKRQAFASEETASEGQLVETPTNFLSPVIRALDKRVRKTPHFQHKMVVVLVPTGNFDLGEMKFTALILRTSAHRVKQGIVQLRDGVTEATYKRLTNDLENGAELDLEALVGGTLFDSERSVTSGGKNILPPALSILREAMDKQKKEAKGDDKKLYAFLNSDNTVNSENVNRAMKEIVCVVPFYKLDVEIVPDKNNDLVLKLGQDYQQGFEDCFQPSEGTFLLDNGSAWLEAQAKQFIELQKKSNGSRRDTSDSDTPPPCKERVLSEPPSPAS